MLTSIYRHARAMLALALSLAPLSQAAQAAEPPKPPAAPLAAPGQPPLAEAFFLPTRLREARLSPSGRWLALVSAEPGQRARLIVADLDEKEAPLALAAFSRVDVARVRWVNDDLLIFGVEDTTDKSRESTRKRQGLLSVQRDGKRMRLLVKREWDSEFPALGNSALEANHSLLALGAAGSDEVILGEWMFNAAGEYTGLRPLRLNARTGERSSLLDDAPPHARDWWFDHQGQARVVVSTNAGQTTVWWRDLKAGKWTTLISAPALDMPWWPAFVDGSGDLYVTRSSQSNAGELLRFDRSSGEPVKEPLASLPGYSADFIPEIDRSNGELLGLTVLTDGWSQVWLKPSMQAAQAKVDAALPGRVNLVACRPCDKPRRLLVSTSSDRQPGEYLLLDVASNTWTSVGTRRPDIVPAQMGSMDLHRIRARDGADLPVWITLPPGASSGPRPAVVLVHGGPWVRGATWDWDSESQFLASRGYVVIQPEFRGSTGYGHDHFKAGFRQWGQAMQDDVTDALRFAIEKGVVDPKRVCIAGGSYGGYSALMGLAKEPVQYRCGVAWAAVTDPRLMFSVHWSDISDESKQHSMPQMIGDPVRDAAMLAANAPLALAAKIKAPLLLVHGGLDRRVPLTHGEQMRAALQSAGHTPEWHVYPDEGHSWSRPPNQVDFWRRVERFLARHLQ